MRTRTYNQSWYEKEFPKQNFEDVRRHELVEEAAAFLLGDNLSINSNPAAISVQQGQAILGNRKRTTEKTTASTSSSTTAVTSDKTSIRAHRGFGIFDRRQQKQTPYSAIGNSERPKKRP